MSSVKTKTRPVLRFAAAIFLMSWLAAFGICTETCLGGMSLSGKGGVHSCCHRQATSDGQTKDSGGHCPDNSFCISLHSLPLSDAFPSLIPPDVQPVFTAGVPCGYSPVMDSSAAAMQCQLERQNSVDRPELSLGEAARSHGPPAHFLL